MITKYDRWIIKEIILKRVSKDDVVKLEQEMFKLKNKHPEDFVFRIVHYAGDSTDFNIYVYNKKILKDRRFKELVIEHLL